MPSSKNQIPHPPPTLAENDSLPLLELGGYPFHCQIFGRQHSHTLLVLHGGPGGDFRYLLPLQELARNYRVVFYDQRGCGLSPRTPAAELHLPQYLQDLDAFVEHFSRKGAVSLLGHSWGGFLALQYLIRHPRKIHKAILAEAYIPDLTTNTRLFFHNLQPAVLKKLWEAKQDSLKLESADAHAQKDYFFGLVLRDSNPGYDCADKPSEHPIWRAGYQAHVGLSWGFKSKKAKKKLSKLDFPAEKMLLLASTCNSLLGVDYQQNLSKKLGKPVLRQIPDSGHYLFTDNPEACRETIRIFLEQD